MNASSWQAVWLLAVEVGAVVLLTLLITWRLRSVVWQRTLWQACLIALVGLLGVEFSAVSFHKRGQAEMPRDAATLEVKDLTLQSTVSPVEVKGEAPVEYQVEQVVFPPMAEIAADVETTVVEAIPVATAAEVSFIETPKQTFPLALAIALGVWLVGSVVLAMRLLVGRLLLLRFCARSQTVFEVSLFDRVQGIARKLGLKQGVRVLETERIQTPVVFGLFRLTIALPVGFTERFERRQQEAILAHELAHLAARDPLWYLLADALVSVLWWHPLVWVARARLQVASELVADEACVLAKHGPETLAECLVSIAKEMHGPGALESIGIEGSGFRSRLGQRVERLLQLSSEMVTKPALWRMRLVKAGVPVLLLSLLVVGTGWMRKDGNAPWSGVVNGAWDTAVGAVSVEDEDIRRDPRPRLVAETKQATNSELPKVEILPTLSPQERTNLYTRIGRVDTNAFFKELERKTGEKLDLKVEGNAGHYSYSSINLYRLLQKYFAAAGLDCEVNGPDGGGTRVSFNPALGIMWVRGTPEEVEIVRKLLHPFLIEALSVSNPNVRTNAVPTGRQRNLAKLDQMVMKEVFFDGLPLSEVVRILQEESVKQDPEKKGINFIINSNLYDQPSSRSGPAAPAAGVDLEKMVIKINPPLKNLRMIEALDAITKVAAPVGQVGLAFEVEEYGVVFRQRVIGPVQMFTRIFKLETNAFVKGLEKRMGIAVDAVMLTADDLDMITNHTAASSQDLRMLKMQKLTRTLLLREGVNFKLKTTEGAQAQEFYNDRTGVLILRATLQDLEIIEQALENLGALEKIMPSPNSDGASSPAGTNELSKLVLEAKQLYELRRLEEAEVKLREVMKRDPENAAAYYYMNLVKEAQYGDLARKRDFEQGRGFVVPGQIPKAGTLPVPNPYVRTNGIQGKMPLRNLILGKLNQIVIKELYFDGMPLAAVVQFLQEESVKQDPEKKGINFIINSNLDDQPTTITNKTAVDLEKVLIKINPPLKNLRMMDALDAITKVAVGAGEHGLAFMVEDYAVVFRQRVIEPPQMFTRVFKVDKERFVSVLEKEAGRKVIPVTTNVTITGQTNVLWRTVNPNNSVGLTEKFQAMARQYFADKGVNVGDKVT